MAILPHNGPDAGSDSPAVDLKRAIATNADNFKSASKSAAWVDEMMALREGAEETDSIGFCSRIFTQLSLPYRDPGTNGAITWVRQNGPMRLQLNPLLDIDADGQAIPVFPYGKYPRLILPWLSTQVVRREAELESDGSLTIELGDSMRDFLKLLNLPYGGKSGRLMREQARRLFGADILFSEDRGKSLLGINGKGCTECQCHNPTNSGGIMMRLRVSKRFGATTSAYRARLRNQFWPQKSRQTCAP